MSVPLVSRFKEKRKHAARINVQAELWFQLNWNTNCLYYSYLWQVYDLKIIPNDNTRFVNKNLILSIDFQILTIISIIDSNFSFSYWSDLLEMLEENRSSFCWQDFHTLVTNMLYVAKRTDILVHVISCGCISLSNRNDCFQRCTEDHSRTPLQVNCFSFAFL